MTGSCHLTGSRVAAEVNRLLAAGDIESADRLITELFGHVINATGTPPHGQFDEPGTTGSEQYDVLLATGLAYALESRGLPAEQWMLAVPALSPEWLWDGDAVASPEFRAFIRRQSPAMFLAKGLLLRDRDVRVA